MSCFVTFFYSSLLPTTSNCISLLNQSWYQVPSVSCSAIKQNKAYMMPREGKKNCCVVCQPTDAAGQSQHQKYAYLISWCCEKSKQSILRSENYRPKLIKEEKWLVFLLGFVNKCLWRMNKTQWSLSHISSAIRMQQLCLICYCLLFWLTGLSGVGQHSNSSNAFGKPQNTH